ncbi:MAG TPA: helix-turn-helix domain-containing protein [Clostridia bacterium]|nr:helix-turn-helix domain-containing protein [Clostridia bacterium]
MCLLNADFPRLLTLLRKEKGISQKSAAKELKISQALLSHYEKGIRECGLDFIVRAADFYGVSCDYLLGRSPDRTGAVISVDEIPEPDAAGKENVFKGSLLPTLNKKLIANSLNIIFDLLQKSESRELTSSVSSFLMIAVYKMFRYIYQSNPKNPDGLFAADRHVFEELSTASMIVSEMKVRCTSEGVRTKGITPFEEPDKLDLSPEKIAGQYPLFAASLSNLITNAESVMGSRKK